jgi:hypothetical protein
MLASIPAGGTVLRLGPNGLEAVLPDAGLLMIEFPDDACWDDVEKTAYRFGRSSGERRPFAAHPV